MPQKGNKYPRTHCIQLHVNKISEASRHFQNFSITEKPIVIVPDTLQCFACFPSFFTCCLTIPDGMWVLYQRCGRDMGEQRPGFICCWPFWYRVSHVVTKQVRRTLILRCFHSSLLSPLSLPPTVGLTSSRPLPQAVSYEDPVRNCPTSDNVMVEVDVSVTFQIGPTIDDARNFVYRLGAHRFDELLGAEIDEVIRGLVHRVPALKVHDLREEFASEAVQSLNHVLHEYGIMITAVKITGVKLPERLEDVLMECSSFQTAMVAQENLHMYNMQKMSDKYDLSIATIRAVNQRTIQEVRADCVVRLAERNASETEATAQREVASTNAEETKGVDILKASAQVSAAEDDGSRSKVELVERTLADTEARRVRADQHYLSTVMRADAAFKVAENQALCLDEDASAEELASKMMLHKREFEAAKARVESMKAFSKKAPIVFSGATGEALVQALAPGSASDLSRGSMRASFELLASSKAK
jgi:regulator of protease activity HflC (stomatin/prohibitin superfamily)